MQKAFDTIDHDILDKMKYLGFTSKTIDWFGSYSKKQNIVNLEKTLLGTGVLNCGVYQGSILDLILFLLYVHHMKRLLKNCNLPF